LAGDAISTSFDQFQFLENAQMNNKILAVRLAQALLSVVATAASVLILQLALVAG
jgi:hypothetical protein